MRLFNQSLLAAVLLVPGAASADVYIEATKAPPRDIQETYFGVHFHRLALQPGERAITTQWPAMAFGSVRLWDSGTRWADISPKAGVWNYERMDTFVNTANQHGAQVLYTLGSTPRWASARPDEPCPYGLGCGAESMRLGHWEEYVRRVAQRYGSRIRAYELWNEPNFSDLRRDVGRPGFYTGSIAQMVEMARVARKVLDEVAPSTPLCTPGFTNGPDRLDRFLAEGGAQYVQAVCYHFYADTTEQFALAVGKVRTIMKRHGISQLPLWNTETGVEISAISDPKTGLIARTREEAVTFLFQLLILGAAAGFERFYYYAWDNSRSGMVTADGQKLFGHDALQRLQTWLLGAQFNGCHAIGPLVSCEATQNQQHYLLVWATKVTEGPMPLPTGMRVTAVERLFGDTSVTPSVVPTGKARLLFDAVPVRIALQHL